MQAGFLQDIGLFYVTGFLVWQVYFAQLSYQKYRSGLFGVVKYLMHAQVNMLSVEQKWRFFSTPACVSPLALPLHVWV